MLISLAEVEVLAEATIDMMRAALDTAHENQLQLDNGSFWTARFGRFGIILDPDDCRDAIEELEPWTDSRASDIWAKHLEWREVGLFPCMEHSATHPMGIFGFAHLTSLWPCSEELFATVQDFEFDTRNRSMRDLPPHLREELNYTARSWRRHMKKQGLR